MKESQVENEHLKGVENPKSKLFSNNYPILQPSFPFSQIFQRKELDV